MVLLFLFYKQESEVRGKVTCLKSYWPASCRVGSECRSNSELFNYHTISLKWQRRQLAGNNSSTLPQSSLLPSSDHGFSMMWRPYPLPSGFCLLNLCNSPFSVALEPNTIWQYSSLICDYLILFFYYFVISGTLITAASGLLTDLEGMVMVAVEA